MKVLVSRNVGGSVRGIDMTANSQGRDTAVAKHSNANEWMGSSMQVVPA